MLIPSKAQILSKIGKLKLFYSRQKHDFSVDSIKNRAKNLIFNQNYEACAVLIAPKAQVLTKKCKSSNCVDSFKGNVVQERVVSPILFIFN